MKSTSLGTTQGWSPRPAGTEGGSRPAPHCGEHSSIQELLPPGRGSAGIAQQCPLPSRKVVSFPPIPEDTRPPNGGEGGFPAPPRKNDHIHGWVVGQNKSPVLNYFFQQREQYYNNEQCPIQPANRICKRLHRLQSNSKSYSIGLSLRESKKWKHLQLNPFFC